jgi:hypothetical protein
MKNSTTNDCDTVIFPNGIYGYHSHLISSASTSFMRISFNVSFPAMKNLLCFFDFSLMLIYVKSPDAVDHCRAGAYLERTLDILNLICYSAKGKQTFLLGEVMF